MNDVQLRSGGGTSAPALAPRDYMKRKSTWLAAAAVVAVIALVAISILGHDDTTQYFSAKLAPGDIHDVVDVTGTINPVITVQVGSQVSGTIAKLNADFNSRVHKGEVIAIIDPALLKGALSQASADLDSAKANVAASKADVVKAQSAVVQTKADYARTVTLAKEGIMTGQALDLAKATYDEAVASAAAAQAAVAQAEAQVNQKAAAVDVARTNLQYTVIRSPIDGTVVARSVDVGQTVAASLQAPTLFTIAQDLKKMQVYAYTDESDVGDVHVGRQVTFKVDAFPKDTFHGTVSQVRMNPTTLQNVVTYDTIIDFDNPDLKLFPGMTAYVTIPVADAHDVLKIPNGALRFKPQLELAEIQALYEKYGIAADQASKRPADTAVVWKLHSDNSIEPVEVALGVTDHAYTALIKVITGELKEGDAVITAAALAKSGASGPGGPVRR